MVRLAVALVVTSMLLACDLFTPPASTDEPRRGRSGEGEGEGGEGEGDGEGGEGEGEGGEGEGEAGEGEGEGDLPPCDGTNNDCRFANNGTCDAVCPPGTDGNDCGLCTGTDTGPCTTEQNSCISAQDGFCTEGSGDIFECPFNTDSTDCGRCQLPEEVCPDAGATEAGVCDVAGNVLRCENQEVVTDECNGRFETCIEDDFGAFCEANFITVMRLNAPQFVCEGDIVLRINGRDVATTPPGGAQVVGTLTATGDGLEPSDYVVNVPGIFNNVPMTNIDVQQDLLVRFDLGDRICVAIFYDPQSTLDATFSDCLSDREAGLTATRTTITFSPLGRVVWEDETTFFFDGSVEVERFEGVYEHDPVTERFRAGAIGSVQGLSGTVSATDIRVDQWGNGGAGCF